METWEKTVLVVFGFVLIAFAFIVVFRPNGILQHNERKREMVETAELNEKIKQENENLYREINRLKNDPDYIESVARKELGMIKEDEIIIRFNPELETKKQPLSNN